MVALALFLAVAPLLWMGAMALQSISAERADVMRNGKLGEAEVLGYSYSGRQHFVEYTFTPEGAPSPIVCRKIIMGVWRRIPAGTRVPVRYKAGFPDISLLVPYASTQMPS